jgi:predicted nucleotidyltransferase
MSDLKTAKLRTARLELLLKILSDGKWHWGEDLASEVTWQFGAIIKEARDRGYLIETNQVGKRFQYRLPLELSRPQFSESTQSTIPDALKQIQSVIPKVLEQVPYLKLLVLFGSRARGEHDATSDWDIALLYDEDQRQEMEQGDWEWLRAASVLQQELKLSDDEIDVVDLNKCSQILAHAIARDGKLIYERDTGEFERFRQRALMNPNELKAFRQQKRTEVLAGLKEWGL